MARRRAAGGPPSSGRLVVISPLHKAARQVELFLGPACEQFGVSFAEMHLIAFVASYPSRVSVIHRVFGLPKSTLTSVLDRLEGLGFVRRTVDPEDRRSFIVAATANGKRVAESARPHVAGFEANVLAAVSARDYEGFRKTLDAIGRVSGVEVRPGSSPGGSEPAPGDPHIVRDRTMRGGPR